MGLLGLSEDKLKFFANILMGLLSEDKPKQLLAGHFSDDKSEFLLEFLPASGGLCLETKEWLMGEWPPMAQEVAAKITSASEALGLAVTGGIGQHYY